MDAQSGRTCHFLCLIPADCQHVVKRFGESAFQSSVFKDLHAFFTRCFSAIILVDGFCWTANRRKLVDSIAAGPAFFIDTLLALCLADCRSCRFSLSFCRLVRRQQLECYLLAGILVWNHCAGRAAKCGNLELFIGLAVTIDLFRGGYIKFLHLFTDKRTCRTRALCQSTSRRPGYQYRDRIPKYQATFIGRRLSSTAYITERPSESICVEGSTRASYLQWFLGTLRY